MSIISIIEEAEKSFDEKCKKGNRLSFLAKSSKDEIKSHNHQTMLKLIEEIQKNMPSHDAVQKILFDIQSYLKDNLEK